MKNTKKDFKNSMSNSLKGIDVLYGGDAQPQNAKIQDTVRPMKRTDSVSKEKPKTDEKSQEPNENDDIRVTLIMQNDIHTKLKMIAYLDRVNLKDTLHDICFKAIEEYEKKNGKVRPIALNRKNKPINP